VGLLTPEEARELAACRGEGSQGIALLLAVSSWVAQPETTRPASGHANSAAGPDADPGSPARPQSAGRAGGGLANGRSATETAAATAVLRTAGWHVITLDATTPLFVSWQRLPRAAEMLVPAVMTTRDEAGK
jgi:hypothetical protein